MIEYTCYHVVIPKQASFNTHLVISQVVSAPKDSLVPREEVGRIDNAPLVQDRGVSFLVPTSLDVDRSLRSVANEGIEFAKYAVVTCDYWKVAG